MYKYTGLLCIIFLFACRKPATTQTQAPPNIPSTENLVKGADISWLTEMEQTGRKFYDTLGREQDLLILLKQYKINTIRLRVWVN
ncbi:MAG: arabinogalactan endo-1,4-beta-galactosidase, partial [Bacteroidetes bacterium]